MKQAKTTIKWLALLFGISTALFVLFYFTLCQNNVITVIFRTLMTGSVVGLITGFILYYSNKARILQDFSNDLLTAHAGFMHLKETLDTTAGRIRAQGMRFNAEEFTIWLQTLSSVQSKIRNTLIVPYKYSPFCKGSWKNEQILADMSNYIRADRDLWEYVDSAKFQMMSAKMALDNDQDPQAPAILINLMEKLRQTGVEADKLVNTGLNTNAWLQVNTSISPITEMDESLRESYKEMLDKAIEEQKNNKNRRNRKKSIS